MTNISKAIAFGAAVTFSVITSSAYAQDDLDDLLNDLESDKPAAAEKAEKPATEAKATEAKAAEETTAEEPVEQATSPAAPDNATEEPAAETPAAEEPVVQATSPAAPDNAAATPAAPATTPSPDAELIENLVLTERNRRRTLKTQAWREIKSARQCMAEGDYTEALRYYTSASKQLTDGPESRDWRRECRQGIAMAYYRSAIRAYELGLVDDAIENIKNAIKHGADYGGETGKMAKRMYDLWLAEQAEKKIEKPVTISDVAHRRNDEEFKSDRSQIRRHLTRSRQHLAMREIEKALEECEIVLVNDPYNQEALRLRRAIVSKKRTVLAQEHESARIGMIADVDKGWRPVYAVNAAALKENTAETVKAQTGEDPERTREQEIEQRMKDMRLPTISFKPPATIMDAVEFFRQASKDYDRPDIPVDKRGFNFQLKLPMPLKAQQETTESDDFSANGDEEAEAKANSNGLSAIPTITASDISFYEALKLVCDSVDYKFIVRGPVIMVMHKDMSTAELLSRKYDVLDAFLERMTSASGDVKDMQAAGFGGGNKKKNNDDGEENQERDWKAFFEQMGVKWPEGSSIMYIKTLGKLYVRNTRENLAEFEKVLQEMGSQPKLIEIETRFVEVSQEDLNSLGFEWILNSDYSLDLGKYLGGALSEGTFAGETSSSLGSWKYTTGPDGERVRTWVQSDGNNIINPNASTAGARWSSASDYNVNRPISVWDEGSEQYMKVDNLVNADNGQHNIGINAFGGSSEQQNGMRYLSTSGNHISGSSASNNDQFMRVNAFFGSADLSMILHMLSQRSDTDLLSAPKVVTKSGENAVIKVVTEFIYPQDYDVSLSSSGSSGGSSSTSSSSSSPIAIVEPQNFTMREVGVILDVTPTYSEANGGTIDLELKPQVVDEPTWKNYGMKIPYSGNTSLQSFDGIGTIFEGLAGIFDSLGEAIPKATKALLAENAMISANNALEGLASTQKNMTYYDVPMEQPFFHVRSIDSKVSVTPGSTVVMGGLITEQRKAMDDKIPFLGDLPFIGRLFRSHAEQTNKRNLLIFVTGRLITPSGRELKTNEIEETTETVETKPEAPAAD